MSELTSIVRWRGVNILHLVFIATALYEHPAGECKLILKRTKHACTSVTVYFISNGKSKQGVNTHNNFAPRRLCILVFSMRQIFMLLIFRDC